MEPRKSSIFRWRVLDLAIIMTYILLTKSVKVSKTNKHTLLVSNRLKLNV